MKNVSDEFEALFLGSLPTRPMASDCFDQYGLFAMSQSEAITKKHIQVNSPGLVKHLLFDLDHSNIFQWEDSNLLEPSWMAINPLNGHSHLAYTLEAPVCISAKGRQKPKRFLEDVRLKMSVGLKADINYVGLTTKNPLHDYWRVIVGERHDYSLNELVEYAFIFPKQSKSNQQKFDGSSRNCHLFEIGRLWAYRNVSKYSEPWELREAVLSHLMGCNRFNPPLSYAEVHSIANSIARWTWRNSLSYNKKLRKRQSNRGVLSGEVRWQQNASVRNVAYLLHLYFRESLTKIANHLRVSRRTVAYWRSDLDRE